DGADDRHNVVFVVITFPARPIHQHVPVRVDEFDWSGCPPLAIDGLSHPFHLDDLENLTFTHNANMLRDWFGFLDLGGLDSTSVSLNQRTEQSQALVSDRLCLADSVEVVEIVAR